MRVQIPPRERAIFWEKGAHYKVQGLSVGSSAKTAEPIDLPFELWTRVGGPKKVQVQTYLPVGANMPSLEGTLPPTVRLLRQCCLMYYRTLTICYGRPA